jgi:peroxiredoxin/Spy/CpxP family protein refolding chaperone
MKKRAIRILCVLAVALGSTLVRAEPPAGENRPGVQLRKFGENLQKLDLTPQQERQVRAVLDDMMARLEEVRRDAKPDDRPMMKVGQIMAEGRGRLAEILTDQQQAKLRDLMQQDRAEQIKRDEPAKPVEPTKKPEPPTGKKSEPKMGEDMMTGGAATGSSRRDRPAAGPLDDLAPIDVGSAAPAFTLRTTADKTMSLASYRNRIVVLIFGSYSSPVFRQRAAALEKLNRNVGSKATFLVIYTREAHALGEWEVERNKDDNVQIEQPKTDAERHQLAKQAVATLNITVPVLVDTIDDTVAKAYGLTPNGAVVIGRDGKVAARQRWFEPVALRQMIDSAVAARTATN